MKPFRLILRLVLLHGSLSIASATVVLHDLFSESKPDGEIKGVSLEHGQTAGQLWQSAGGKGVYFKDNTLTFGATGDAGFGKAHVDFIPEKGRAYQLSYQLSVSVDEVSTEAPRDFSWYGGFGTQSDFIDHKLGAGFKLYYNSSYNRNQLKLGIGSGHQREVKTNQVEYALGRNVPAEWSAQIEILWDGSVAVYSIDGEVIGTVPYSGPIGGLWFKGDSMKGAPEDLVSVRNLTVRKLDATKPVSIPEANHFGLWLSIGAVLIVCARRR